MSLFERASPAVLSKTAGLMGTKRLDYVEIDILLTHILQRMYEADLMDRLVFKGGTMLRKMVFGANGRLSTDLDFVVRSIDDTTPDDLALAIASVFQEPYRGLTFDVDLRDISTTEGSCRANPRCKTRFTPRGHVIKIEVSHRADPILQPVLLPHLKQPYFADLDFDPVDVPCLQLNEAIGEKVRAAFQRPKIRDLHDLQQLRRFGFDPSVVRRLTVLKVWEAPEGRSSFEPFSYDTFVRRMNTRIAHGEYDEGDLQGLLRSSLKVDLKTMVKEVSETYSFLRDLTPDEEFLMQDQHRKLQFQYEALRESVRGMVDSSTLPKP